MKARNSAKARATGVEPRSDRLLSIVSAPGSFGSILYFAKLLYKAFVPDENKIDGLNGTSYTSHGKFQQSFCFVSEKWIGNRDAITRMISDSTRNMSFLVAPASR